MSYVHLGTPYDVSTTFVPVWQQEAEGRFHGAFTGGFSAGYFNTVGSREGWTPKSFYSSRSQQRHRETDAAFSPDAVDTTTTAAVRLAELMDDEDKMEFGYQASLRLKKPPATMIQAQSSGATALTALPRQTGAYGDDDEDERDIYDQSELQELRRLREKERPGSRGEPDQLSSMARFAQVGSSPLAAFHLCPDTLIFQPKVPSISIPDGWTSSRKKPKDSVADVPLATETGSGSVARFLLSDTVASKALQGYIPFSQEPEKQKRYVAYLTHFSTRHRSHSSVNELLQALHYGTPGSMAATVLEDTEQELREFHSAASIYHKPMSKSLALRFTSESQAPMDVSTAESSHDGIHVAAKSSSSPIETLIRRGLLLKRTSQSWLPSSLLLKRFHIDATASQSGTHVSLSHVQPVLNDSIMLQLQSELQSTAPGPESESAHMAMEHEPEASVDPIEQYSIAFLKSIFESHVIEEPAQAPPNPPIVSSVARKSTASKPPSQQNPKMKIQRQTLSFEVEEDEL